VLTRRTFMKSAPLMGLGSVLSPVLGRDSALSWPVSRGSQRLPITQPNILMLIIDDLNSWVGYLGMHPQTQTPHIDRLADQAVAFTHAYCTVSLCNPSRIAVLTGQSPKHTGIFRNQDDGRHLPHMVTHFQNHGYRAIGSGKVFHNTFPIDTWDAVIEPGGRLQFAPATVPAIGVDVRPLDAGPYDRPESDVRDFKAAQAIAETLQQPQPQPFFLAYGTWMPHVPWYVPQSYFERFPLEFSARADRTAIFSRR
jgi:arylsulfatase A-like enzyme